MKRIIVAGIGTDVGKTVVSAILTCALKADFWKPIESGDSDTERIKKLLDSSKHTIFTPIYSLKNALSPHHAAHIENVSIEMNQLVMPKTDKTLVIETPGGVLVPVTYDTVSLDHFKTWNADWILVSRHYLGSINHTLLTIEALKLRRISIRGLIFNGDNPDSEKAILNISKVPTLGKLLPEEEINQNTIQKYAKQWKQQLKTLLI
jgi:dethiobiotin synthetase